LSNAAFADEVAAQLIVERLQQWVDAPDIHQLILRIGELSY
jgi:hypothetical protein